MVVECNGLTEKSRLSVLILSGDPSVHQVFTLIEFTLYCLGICSILPVCSSFAILMVILYQFNGLKLTKLHYIFTSVNNRRSYLVQRSDRGSRLFVTDRMQILMP